ncbi:MAG: hypothetical protein PUB93_03345 [Firmicutes bacterium]|nr:hypothetical protein [Bacillota bacterium]
MAIPLYLAMTAAEFRAADALPEHIAWMACHFSPYGTGLTNLPERLPEGSLLILNDRMPPDGHDPERIAGILGEVMAEQHCRGLLLDFQRPGNPETAAVTRRLTAITCPAAVSERYAADGCPVFLPPVPPFRLPAEYLAPWKGREIWLEAALDGAVITVTGDGSRFAPLPPGDKPEAGFPDEALHCHYRVEAGDAARFTLWRTREDVDALLREAESLGVALAVGLYQELG